MSFFNSMYVISARACTKLAFFFLIDTFHPFLFGDRRRRPYQGQRVPKRSPTPISATSPNATVNDGEPPASPVQGIQKPLYLCKPFVEAALVKGNFKTIVMLPKYVDIMEWVAVNSESHSSRIHHTLTTRVLYRICTNVQSLTSSRTLICFMELYQNAAHNSLVRPCPPVPRK